MEFLMAYFIFCLTTAIMASIYILIPVLRQVAKNQPLNPVVEYRLLTHIAFFTITTLCAPAIFLSVIIPSFLERFKFTLAETLEN